MGEQGFHVPHDVPVIRICAIPFQHGVFRIVPGAAFAFPEAGADLVNPVIPCREEAFHVKFRRGAQETVPGRFGVNVKFKRRGGESDGGFDFDETGLSEPVPQGGKHATA